MNMNEYENVELDTLELPLEDGTMLECAIIDDFDFQGKSYLVLSPVEEGDVLGDDVYFYIYQEDGDDIILDYIDSEEELKAASDEYWRLVEEAEAE